MKIEMEMFDLHGELHFVEVALSIYGIGYQGFVHTEDENAGKIELIPVEPVDTIEEVVKALQLAGYILADKNA